MQKSNTKYMHLVGGQPAVFDGEQLVRGRSPVELAESLAQIRQEQQASRTWRAQNCAGLELEYSHVEVRVG